MAVSPRKLAKDPSNHIYSHFSGCREKKRSFKIHIFRENFPYIIYMYYPGFCSVQTKKRKAPSLAETVDVLGAVEAGSRWSFQLQTFTGISPPRLRPGKVSA